MGVSVPSGDHTQTMGTVATTQGDRVGTLTDKPPQHNTRGVIVGEREEQKNMEVTRGVELWSNQWALITD